MSYGETRGNYIGRLRRVTCDYFIHHSILKVLILSTTDISGGAARAAYRLHQGLLTAGIDSQMLVQNKLGDDQTVIAPTSKIQRGIAAIKPTLDQLPFSLHRNRDAGINIYSAQWLPNKTVHKIEQINPDIINIHWICGGFVPIEALAKLKQPLVWTFHDMWAFTGGCHYSGKCDHYQQSCGSCPQLGSDRNWDLSRWIWQRKAKAWKDLNLTVVTPSKWLAECAQASTLFQNLVVKVIGNGIDPQIYQPHPKHLARRMFKLPPDKKIILFGAVSATKDYRKGFHLLMPALRYLEQYYTPEEVELVIFGASQPSHSPNFSFKAHYLGKLNDDISISLLYSAVDVFIAPSVQENLSNTVMEALACGTPSVAFDIGGMSDLIEHQQNGYLATPYDSQDLAGGIAWILEKSERWQSISNSATEKIIQEFTIKKQTQEYIKLYQEILAN